MVGVTKEISNLDGITNPIKVKCKEIINHHILKEKKLSLIITLNKDIRVGQVEIKEIRVTTAIIHIGKVKVIKEIGKFLNITMEERKDGSMKSENMRKSLLIPILTDLTKL